EVAERAVLPEAQQEGKRVFVDLGIVLVEREAPEYLVVRRGVPVDSQVTLMGTHGLVHVAYVVSGDAADAAVRQRIERGVAEDGPGDGADPAGGDDVARERLAGQRVANHGAEAREVAVAPRRRRHRRGLGPGCVVPGALIIGEEEDLVLHERSAERGPEDVLPPLLPRRARAVVGPGVRIQA